MNAEAKKVAAAMPPKKKTPTKSAARVSAELALQRASEQEKSIARQALKSIKFKELARARVRRALKVLDGIEKLASRAAYSWTEQEAEKVLSALTARMNSVINRFAGQKTKDAEFDL